MTTKEIGDISEAKILAKLLNDGYIVLLPFGENKRYDLVVNHNNKFIKIQCKTASNISNNRITFYPCSIYKIKGKYIRRIYTTKEIDFFYGISSRK